MVQKKFKIKSKNALSSLTESVLSLAKNNSPVAESPRADAVGEITIDQIIESTGGLVTNLQPEDRLYMETVVNGKYEARATTVASIAEFGGGTGDVTKEYVDTQDASIKVIVDANTASITTNTTDIATNVTNIEALDTRVTALEAGTGGGTNGDYALKTDLDTKTTFLAMNPVTFPPVREPLDKILSDMFNIFSTSMPEHAYVTNAQAVIDCKTIDWVYNILNINMLSDFTEDIKIINIQFSNIKKIIANVANSLSYTLAEDITVNATTGANNLFRVSRMQNNIAFYMDDTIELFSSKVARYTGLSFSSTNTTYNFEIPYLSVEKICFSIEFSKDFYNVVSYFNIDEFCAPITYKYSTKTASLYSGALVYWVNNPQNNKSFAPYILTTVYNAQADFLVDDAPISILDSAHHIVCLHTSITPAQSMTLSTVSQILVTSSGNLVPIVLLGTQEVTNHNISAYRISSSGMIDDLEKFKEFRDSNSGTCSEYRVTDQNASNGIVTKIYPTTQASQVSFGTTIEASYTSGMSSAEPVTPVIYNKFGIGYIYSYCVLSSVTYFEKGEFDFPTGLARSNQKLLNG